MSLEAVTKPPVNQQMAQDDLILTPLGTRMLHFPLQPFRAAVLLHAFDSGCPKEIIDILSLQEAGNPIIDSTTTRETAAKARIKYAHRDGDHLTGLNIFRAFIDLGNASTNGKTVTMRDDSDDSSDDESSKANGRFSTSKSDALAWCKENALNHKVLKEAIAVRKQLRELAIKLGQDPDVSAGEDSEKVLRCLCKGLWANTAKIQPDGRSYKQLLGPRELKIHPSSTMSGRKVPTILFDELALTTAFYAHGVSAIEDSWLTGIKAFHGGVQA